MASGLTINKDESSLPLILALDTSSKRASMAIARGPHLIASLQGAADEKRAERLWTEIDSLLSGAGLTINDVGLFSICTGPGGFTGLRVGIAAIKGLAAASNKQIIGVTSLESVAAAAAPARNVFATVNAYKGEIYSQLFGFDMDGSPIAMEPPQVSSPAKALERVANLDYLVFAGDWAAANTDFIKELGGSRFSEAPIVETGKTGWFVSDSNRLSAESIAEIAFKKYSQGGGDNPEQIRAYYISPSEAEIKLSEGVLGSKLKRSVMQE